MDKETKTIILISTQTSATGSICRIINKLNKSNRKFLTFGKEKIDIIGKRFEDIPKYNHIVLHNRPDFLRMLKNPEDYRYIVNFRDPRDRLCNSFHWMQQHPFHPGESKDEINKRKDEIEKLGIDNWVIQNIKPQYESFLFDFIIKNNNCDMTFATYAELCLNFDRFLLKVSTFLDEKIDAQTYKELDSERCDNLHQNKEWIGGRWKGADILPGRHKNELNETTISVLNEKYKSVLNNMSKYDNENSLSYK
ncbi:MULTISPECIES: hypothetical protein [unclassified Vibrio]|uniref:Sulfotransferase domain-containing protein n=1 Tax=Vibrio sp. HB236076 TaxID=3232307 RepID=A0AB39HGW2_9VIBR|nr:hypothetical protein [Vibrio sp. HB161653]MDP5254341.1 hypothetical protein [Vibrio sp. HB161653]